MKNNNINDQEEQIQNGEIVKSNDGAQILLDLEQLIKNHITRIDKLKEDLGINKEMLNDIFENDPTYKEHAKLAKEANKTKAGTKNQILKQPQAKDLNEKIKEMSAENKELQNSLSEYLREYQKMTGVNEIEGEDGEVREIVYVTKLVKKSKF